MANRWGNSDKTLFSWAPKSLQTVTEAMKLKDSSFFLRRKAMTNIDRVLKSRYITLLKKVQLVKTMLFPIVKYVCERCPIKKAEQQRTDAFILWCLVQII